MSLPFPARLQAVAVRAAAALTGGALVASSVLVPAAPAVADVADLPAPSGITIEDQACGAEPITVVLDRNVPWRIFFGATFDDPGITHARVETLDAAGELRETLDRPVVEGVLSYVVMSDWLTDNAVNTLVVRAQSEDGTQTGPAVECSFLLHRAPGRGLSVLPVLAAEAVYPYSNVPRGGVGVPGAFVIASPMTADAVSFAYGTSAALATEPTEWTTVPAAENVVVPFVPTYTGWQYLWVAEVDETGLMGVATIRSIKVAEPGTAELAPPVVSVTEPEDALPDDGMIPLRLTLTPDLHTSEGPVARGEVTLYNGATELAHTTFDTRVKGVLVRQSQVGTGYRDLRVEYVQYLGADTVTETAKICAASCVFSGGSAKVVSVPTGNTQSHPSYNSHYRVEFSGFSPTPLSYTYQWLRDGAGIKGATTVDYLSSPADVGRRVSVRVTAHGPRMQPRSVTSTPFTVRERDTMHVDYGLSNVGSRWESGYCYCMSRDGDTANWTDSGRAVEALIAHPSSSSYTTRIYPPTDTENDTYAAFWFEMEGYVQGRGWEGLKVKTRTHYVGTVGENRRLEAFRVKPAGPHARFYDVWYRAYVPKYGWLGWAKSGENAGTTGYGYRIEAVQMRVLPKGTRRSASGTGNAPFYDRATQNQVTVQPYLRPSGWKPRVHGGTTAGLTETSQRLNALRVDVDGLRYPGGVRVSAKVEGDGWRSYVSDTKVAGTYDRTDRTSAYRMRLTGEMAERYDIYYRVHVAGTGWLGWAKNGAGAGTESYMYRNTAVQVVLVKKGERPLMSPGRAAYKR